MTENNARHFCSLVLPPQAAAKTRAALLKETKWGCRGSGDRPIPRGRSGPSTTRPCRRGGMDRREDGESVLPLREFGSRGRAGRIRAGRRVLVVPRNAVPAHLAVRTHHELRVAHPPGFTGRRGAPRGAPRVRARARLIHEHQNPDRPIAWNRRAVIADLSGPPNYWPPPETIEHNIFERYDPRSVSATPTDPDSIMMYPIPARWTTDGFSADLNSELSDTDKEFIRDAYPW